MLLLSACEDGDVLNTIRIVLIVLDVLKNLIATIVIIFGIIDFFKVVFNGKDDKFKDSFKMFIKRIIAGLVVIFIPSILAGILNSLDAKFYVYNECIIKATPEEIQKAYYTKATKLIQIARESLDYNDYADAKAYIERVVDSSNSKDLEKSSKYFIFSFNLFFFSSFISFIKHTSQSE